MTRIALGIEYDGSAFKGWQAQLQPGIATVQEALESSLTKLAGHPVKTTCAGRTDAGVHALGQVVHYNSEALRTPQAWVFGTNNYLPSSVRVLWYREMPEAFDARYSALSRRYRYLIYNHPLRPSLLRQGVGWYYRPLAVEPMQAAARYWIGEHDFSSFRAAGCQSRSPVRSVYAIDLYRTGDQIIFDITANAFLQHMVRNMVGVLMRIGAGFEPSTFAQTVLDAKDRRAAALAAPASGLYLIAVHYPQHFGLPAQVPAVPGFVDNNQ
jgi:tRNA pseudouridine38-40 synthase